MVVLYRGESGAGKSMTAKLAIEYLVEAADSEMACKIRETGCILEAFGNAKTSRNKNSSRFVSSESFLVDNECVIFPRGV